MERKPDHSDDGRVFTLPVEKRKKTDIVLLVEKSIRDAAAPDTIKTSVENSVHDPYVWIDDEGILKTLVNLQANAIEAMPGGGELFVCIEGDEHLVTITIRDTGTGISKENMDNLFTPFFTTKPVGEGTGLGLPLAYATVKKHSGKIEIESNADTGSGPTGTRIKIILPRGEEKKPDITKLILHGDD